MTLKRNRIIVFVLIVALIMQAFVLSENTVLASANNANNDFESLSGNTPTGWSAKNAVISSDNSFWHSGNHSAKIEKSDLDESEITTDALELITKDGVNGDFTLEFSFWYRAKNANVFMRLDALVYDSEKNLLTTLTGNTVMLPRSENICKWTQLSTREKVSSNATYISYKIVLTGVNSVTAGDRATVYVDDITCKPAETFSECISDFCDFHSLDESGEVSGFSVKEGTFTANNGVGMFYGTSTDSTLTYKSEKLTPECSYQISAKYTSSADFTAGISYYGINGEILKTDSIELSSSNDVSALSFETSAPDALYSVFFVRGNADITLDDLYFFKVSTRVNDSFSGWTADSLWYPEDAVSHAYYQFRYFRVTFQLDCAVNDAYIEMAYDDNLYGLTVNGNWVSTTPLKTVSQYGKKDVHIFDIKNNLAVGKNVISAKVLNCGLSAGFMLEGYIHTTDGKTYHLTANPENTKVSRLNCVSSHASDYSSFKESPSDWNKKNYNDTAWETPIRQGIPPYSNMGSGEVAFAFEYSDYFSFLPSECPTVTVTGGEQMTTAIKFTSFKNSKIPETVTGLFYSGDVLKAHIPISVRISGNKIYFSYLLPDYLPAGKYSLKISGIGLLGKSDVLFYVTLNQSQKTNPTVCTKKENGSVKLKVNNETVSPVMYMRPSNSSAYYNYTVLSNIKDSGISLYCTFNGYLDGSDGSPIWLADNSIDYSAFDSEIYRTLDLNKDAYIIANISTDAPKWWCDANKSECQTDADGNVIDKVSFASLKYRNDVSKVIELLVSHIRSSAYSHRIIGIKLTAGKTNEWMNYLRNDDDTAFYSVDYSSPMREAFKNATAYEIPSLDERASSKYSLVLDQNSKASVIAYNKFISQCVTDSLLCYAKTVKTVEPNIIVGGYNGYLWFENSSLGIGTSHTTAQQVLSSNYIDFVCSPVNYSERINGFATGYMTMTDSIASYGKLYIAEQDNRTLYSHIFGKAQSDNAVGYCNTLNDSVNQITRDLSTDLISGSGFWLYDMEGGWFDNGQIRSAVKTLKNEYDYSQSLDMSSNSEVAVFVGDDTYDYLNSDIYLSDLGSRSTRLLSQLYVAQRLELSKMGTSYDTFAVSDLVSEKAQTDWSQYKLIIMLSPFKLSSDERSAIDEKFKRDGKYILWVYLPGISDGITSSASNISSLVDMNISVDSGSSNTIYAKICNSDFPDCSFGTKTAYNTPFAKITGNYTDIIAKYPSMISYYDKNVMAYKNCQNYTSVYSAVPNIPASVLKKLCSMSGVHIYSNDADTTVQTNSSYISLNSAYSGTQTVTLDKNYRIFDVLSGCTVAQNTNKMDVTLSAGETKIYRLEEPEKPRNYDGGILTNGDFYLKSADGYTDWSVGSMPVSSPNLVVNGDFENKEDFYSWSASASDSANVEILRESDGNSVAKVQLFSSNSQGYIQGYQFDAKPSTEYTVSYRLKIKPNVSGGNGAQCYSLLYMFNSNGQASGGLINESGRWNTPDGDWQTVTYKVVTNSDTKTVRIDLMHNAVAGISYWDDISCVQTNETVENVPVLSKSTVIDNGIRLSGNGCYLLSPTLCSKSKASYLLKFNCFMENSGKAIVTVYRSDKVTKVKCIEIDSNAQTFDYCVAVPSKDAEIYYLKISLQEATAETAVNIGNITMCENKGDLNFDGLISAEDLVAMRKALIGIESKTEFMDLNGDLNIDILDLVRQKKNCVVK